MPLPQLRTNYLIEPVDVPGTMLKAAQIDNYLFRKEQARREADRQAEKDRYEKIRNRASDFLKVASAPTPDIAQKVAKMLGFEFSKSDYVGNPIVITDQKNRFKLSGPQAQVLKVLREVRDNPDSLSTEEFQEVTDADGNQLRGTNLDHLLGWSAALGVSMEQLEPTMTPEEEIKHEAKLEGAKIRARESVKREFKDKKKEKEGWDEPYVDPNTNALVQRNKDTGEIKVLVKEGAEPGAENYLLPNKTTVLSYDKGRTYIADDGTRQPMPPGSMKSPTLFSGQDIRAMESQKRAREDLKRAVDSLPVTAEEMRQKAIQGTGAWAMGAAALNNILGTVGVDRLFSKDGLFNDTMESRQALRIIRQIAKAALLNSSRAPIWEQKNINKLLPDTESVIVNPRTEAKKFDTLRKIMKEERRFNNEAILRIGASNPDLLAKIESSNVLIDKLLGHLGVEGKKKLSDEDTSLVNKYRKKK